MSAEYAPLDIVWVLFSATLVFAMQAGFTCLESGLVRSKNSINVAIKNAVDFIIAGALFYLISFGIMFGFSDHGWIGRDPGALLDPSNAWIMAYFLFQLTFCGTATTIVSGAVAERMRFGGYCVCSAVVAGLIYPLFGHWAWGGAVPGTGQGWLRELGFVDFAGSTVVHSVGGWVALAAVLVIGPRLGRFGPDGRPIEGHDLTLATLGMFILWLGWFGFNGGSAMGVGERLPGILANTIIAGVFGGVAGLFLGWSLFRKPEVVRTLNGILGGLVAITASCNIATVGGAAVTGFVAGVVVIAGLWLLERLAIDDAVGAVPVHLMAGIWGTLAVALVGDAAALPAGGRAAQLGVQLAGVAAAAAVAFGGGLALLHAINRLLPLRVSPEQERLGLNISEHGATTAVYQLLTEMDRQRSSGDFTWPVAIEPYTEAGEVAAMYNNVLAKFNALSETQRQTQVALEDKNLLLEQLSTKLSKYLSPQVYSSIFSGERDVVIATQRKKLTVFFSDIADFTETTDDMEPEDLTALLNHYLTEMATIALEYGATVDKFIGDAILLFFGDPETKGVKEDALACVEMAIAMQRRMRRLQEQWQGQGYRKPFHLRIGINTGYCNVGNFGSEHRMDYTIIGGQVNLASRLQSHAELGSILMSYETYALVREHVDAVEMPPIRVKGIAKPVIPYKVVGLVEDVEIAGRARSDDRSILANLERMTDTERASAVLELEEILRKLKQGSA